MTYYHINQNNSHFSASIITEYKDWKDYVKGGYYRPKSATLHKVDGEEDIIPTSFVDKELGKAKRTHSTDLVAEVLNVTLLEPEDEVLSTRYWNVSCPVLRIRLTLGNRPHALSLCNGFGQAELGRLVVKTSSTRLWSVSFAVR